MIELNNRNKWIIGILIGLNGIYLSSKVQNGNVKQLLGTMIDVELPKVICFSPAEIAIPIVQLLFSTCVILLTCTICHYARKTIDHYISDSLIRILLLEAVAAADLCGCCFELIIVADNFGVWMYGIYLFMLTIWWSKAWGEATACPYTHLEDVVQGKQDIQLALMKTWAELTGGVLVFRYIQLIWNLELVETHEDRAYESCSADLQVPMWLGAVIEGAATCLCQLTGKALGDLEPKHSDVISSFIGTSLVVAAFNYSGGYFNPVLATSLKFSCKGNTFTEHVVVYWIGACLGSVASIFLYHNTQVKSIICTIGKKKSDNEDEEEELYEKEE